jgi:S1-C subfamily serine protease
MSPTRQTIAALLAALGLALSGVAAAEENPPAPPPANPLEALERAVCDVVDRVRPGVVQVSVHRTFVAEGGREDRDLVATSGIVWSADGLVVSLGRAFETAESIEVALPSGEKRPADLVGTDDETGLALLRIDPAGLREPLRAAPLGSSKSLRAGSIVVAVSNPFGLVGSASVGTIAGRDRVVRRGQLALADVLQITTPVNPGDPGGALANARGEVVGVIASTYDRPFLDYETMNKLYQDALRLGERFFGKSAQEGLRALRDASGTRKAQDEARFAGQGSPFGGQGIGFAIPIDQARSVVERLKNAGKVERGWLGVQVVAIDPLVRSQLQLKDEAGVLVVGVKEGSPAEKGGLRQYDILTRYAGREVADLREFRRMVLETAPGTAVKVEVLRAGERRTIELTPAARGAGGQK